MYDPDHYIQPPYNRRKSPYDREERSIIRSFKEKYLAACTPAERRTVIAGELCVELFNFWVISRNISFSALDTDVRVKDLLAYVRNKWRLQKSTADSQPTFMLKISDLIWEHREEEVFEEIARLMNVRQVDSTTPGWFGYRSKALKNVRKRLSDADIEAFRIEIEKRKKEGNPEHIRRKLAHRHMHMRLDVTAQRNYLEMGLLSVNFVITRDKSGQWIMEVHDCMSELLNVNAPTFEEENELLVGQCQRAIFKYVEHLFQRRDGTNTKFQHQITSRTPHLNYLEVDRPTGFPKLKQVWRSAKNSKKIYEALFRRYLAMQYALACGRPSPVPYGSIIAQPKKFIESRYLPKNWTFKDPRNANLIDITMFFEHIWERQQVYPLDQVFRFRKITSKHRNGQLTDAPYPNAFVIGASGELAAPDRNIPDKGVPEPTQPKQRKDPTAGNYEQVINFQGLYKMPSATPSQSAMPVPDVLPRSVPGNHRDGAASGAMSTTDASQKDTPAPPQIPHAWDIEYELLPQENHPNSDFRNTNQTSMINNTPGYNLNLRTHWPSPDEPFINVQPESSTHDKEIRKSVPIPVPPTIDPALLAEIQVRSNRTGTLAPHRSPTAIMENIETSVSLSATPIRTQKRKATGNDGPVSGVNGNDGREKKRHGPDEQAQEEAAKWQVSGKRVRKPRQRGD